MKKDVIKMYEIACDYITMELSHWDYESEAEATEYLWSMLLGETSNAEIESFIDEQNLEEAESEEAQTVYEILCDLLHDTERV